VAACAGGPGGPMGGRQAAGTAPAVGGREAARGRPREGPAGVPRDLLAGRHGERSERHAEGGPAGGARARPSVEHRANPLQIGVFCALRAGRPARAVPEPCPSRARAVPERREGGRRGSDWGRLGSRVDLGRADQQCWVGMPRRAAWIGRAARANWVKELRKPSRVPQAAGSFRAVVREFDGTGQHEH